VLLMRELLAKWGWRSVEKQLDSRFVWMDPSHAKLDLLSNICKSQRVNFIPGMREMCNKKPLYRLLNRARRMCETEETKALFFFPPTFVLPEDYDILDGALQNKKPKTFICKPDGGAQGVGIFLLRSGQEHKLQPGDKYVVQRYIHKPLLLDGLKFDLRLYVLITSGMLHTIAAAAAAAAISSSVAGLPSRCRSFCACSASRVPMRGLC
jgi:hypothetical protein